MKLIEYCSQQLEFSYLLMKLLKKKRTTNYRKNIGGSFIGKINDLPNESTTPKLLLILI